MRNFLNRAFLAFTFVVFACSCSQKIMRPSTYHYTVNITDNIAERRFDISLESTDSRSLCISSENWPNSFGYFTVEKNDTFLQIGTNNLPAKSTLMSAYCPGGCGEYRIESGRPLYGFISYEVFGDPENISKESQKLLNFPVVPYYCRLKNEKGARVN